MTNGINDREELIRITKVYKEASFQKELVALINKFSRENGSDTPDFILAEYLTDCLEAFDKATKLRTEWNRQDQDP